jgi:PAS domain S-box-containing protein
LYRILVVEDDALIAAGLVSSLSSLGYSVLEPVATGEDAIRAVTIEKPDLVLMDIQLIGAMTGIEAAQIIRAVSDLPVIYLTSYNDDLRLRQARITEPYGYLTKPAQSRELKATIEMALYKHALDRQLRESEMKYRALFSAESDGIFVVDKETGTIIDCNDAITALYGYRKDEVIGRPNTDISAEPEATRAATETVLHFIPVRYHRKKDGSVFPVEITANCVSIQGRDVIIAAVRDITERKLAEERLAATVKRTREEQEVVAAISLSPLLFSGDVLGLSAVLTEKASKVLGVGRAGVWLFNGKGDELQCIDLYEDLFDRHSCEFVLHRHEFRNEFEVLSTAKFIDADDPLTDPRTRGYVENYLRPNHITSMLDAVIRVAGQNLGVLCFEHVDRQHHWENDEIAFACQLADQVGITLLNRDRMRAEETLRESEEKYRSLVENIHDAIYIFQKDRFLFTNTRTSEVTGYSPEELRTIPFIDLIHPDDRGSMLEITRKRWSGETVPPTFECRILRKDGEIRYMELAVTSIPYLGGNASLGAARDITERKKAEQALQESELLLREVFDNANDSVFLLERSPAGPGKYLLVNDKAVRMLGYSKEEFRSMSPRDIVPEDVAKKVMPPVIKKLLKDGHATFESVHRRKDGSTYPVEVSTHTFRYQGKDVDLSITRDISERKKAEAALRETQELFSTAFQNGPLLQTISDIETGRYLEINTAFTRVSGFSRDEVIGKTSVELGWISQADRDDLIRDLREHGKVVGKELRLTRKDGEPVWCLFFGEIITVAGKDRLLSLAEDITERKRAEVALQESERRLQTIFNSTFTFIALLRPDGRVTDVNDTALQFGGILLEDIVNKPFWEGRWWSTSSAIRDRLKDAIARVSEGESVQYEEDILSRENQVITIDFSLKPVKNDTGTILSLVAEGHNISDRKQMERAIIQANKKLTLLSSITRHDITNQLTVLQGYLRIIDRKLEEPSLKDYLSKTAMAARRITSMIQFTQEYETIGVSAPLWQDCRALVDASAEGISLGTIRVYNEIPAGTEIFADRLITKVWYNLLDNAVKYGGPITTIRFSVEYRGKNPVIVCEDDGGGIPEEEKEKIFDLGFGRNTGFGLAISREILAITGITITENGVPGNGARFEILVPEGAFRHRGPA